MEIFVECHNSVSSKTEDSLVNYIKGKKYINKKKKKKKKAVSHRQHPFHKAIHPTWLKKKLPFIGNENRLLKNLLSWKSKTNDTSLSHSPLSYDLSFQFYSCLYFFVFFLFLLNLHTIENLTLLFIVSPWTQR